MTARRHKKKCKIVRVLVSLGSGSYSVPAGSSKRINFRLNGTGKKLLSRFYKLPTTFKFTATSGTTIPTGTVTFSYRRITSSIAYAFIFHPSFTTVAQLVVSSVPQGGSVGVACRGGGCPFGHRSFKRKRRVALTGMFGGSHLRPGTIIQISITAANSVGKVAIFTIHASAAPTEVKRCLPPGARRPLKCAS